MMKLDDAGASRNSPPPERLRRLAAQLHALGVRPLYELFQEVSEGRDLWERLERYAALYPLREFINAYGGDCLPPAAQLIHGDIHESAA